MARAFRGSTPPLVAPSDSPSSSEETYVLYAEEEGFDGDGVSEVLVGTESEVIVVRGRDFELEAFPLGGARGVLLTPGDLDGDGAPDLIASGGDDFVAVLLGDGAGGLLPATGYAAAGLPAAIRYGRLAGGTLGLLLLDQAGRVQAVPISCLER